MRVRSVNAKGESDPSPLLFGTTKPSEPGDIEGILFTSGTGDAIKIEWSGADAKGSPIAAYEVNIA